jgi:hypothetical protein
LAPKVLRLGILAPAEGSPKHSMCAASDALSLSDLV